MREPPPVGAAVVLGGYERDHPLVLVADTAYRILGQAVDAGGRALLRHSCASLPGLSGAPLLIDVGGKRVWLQSRLLRSLAAPAATSSCRR